MIRRLPTLAYMVVLATSLGCGADDAPPADVADAAPPPPDARSVAATDCDTVPTAPLPETGLDPFYKKFVDVGGIPVVSSENVSDEAFAPACDILVHMLQLRDDVRLELVRRRIRVGIIAKSEVTTDLPENSNLYELYPDTDWDVRTRGVGATASRPLCSVGEENLLRESNDAYAGDDILVHEFGHTFFDLGIALIPGGNDAVTTLQELYDAVIQAGTYYETYAATNTQEYWAESVQSWFGTHPEAIPGNGIHNAINTRAELIDADPDMAEFLRDYFVEEDYVAR